jgi:hypothetical protein
MGLTIFLTSLCVFILAFCMFVISSTLKSHDEIFSKAKSKSWQSIARTFFICVTVFMVSTSAGVFTGWNGHAASIDPRCYSSKESYLAADTQIKSNLSSLKVDRIGDLIFGWIFELKDVAKAIDEEKSGSDFIREVTISALFCKIELADTAATRTVIPRNIAAWDILNFNTVVIYTTSIFCFITIAMLGLFTGRHALVDRGRRLKLLLMALASLMSVGVAQLKAYFNWPIGMLKETPKSLSALADASANYTGLVGSATLFVTFIFPLLLWRYDTANESSTTDSDKYETHFKLSDVLAFAAIFAAPAFSGSFTKLLSGGH